VKGRKLKLEGVYPALITPFTEDDKVDEEGLKTIIDYVTKGGVSGVVPCGTTGESATLSMEEHKMVIKAVVEYSRVPVIAGTGSNNTKEALELTEFAGDVGADAALVITPYYNKPNWRGLVEHYKKIAAVAKIPIILYNVPSRTGLNMTPDVVVELAEIPEIIGLKEASNDLNQVMEIIERTEGKDFVVLSGNDILTLPMMALGAKGVISVAANIVPKMMSTLTAEMLRGRVEHARKLHYELLPLFRALFLETNPIPVKAAAEMIGLIKNSRLRLPLAKISWDNEDRVRNVLKELRLLKYLK